MFFPRPALSRLCRIGFPGTLAYFFPHEFVPMYRHFSPFLFSIFILVFVYFRPVSVALSAVTFAIFSAHGSSLVGGPVYLSVYISSERISVRPAFENLYQQNFWASEIVTVPQGTIGTHLPPGFRQRLFTGCRCTRRLSFLLSFIPSFRVGLFSLFIFISCLTARKLIEFFLPSCETTVERESEPRTPAIQHQWQIQHPNHNTPCVYP